MTDALTRGILLLLVRSYGWPVSPQQAAQALDIDLSQAEAVLAELARQQVLSHSRHGYAFNAAGPLGAGIYHSHTRGYGFIHLSGRLQYYVAPGNPRRAGDGDVVMGQVVARYPGKAPMVRIDEVLFRQPRVLAAQFCRGEGLGSVTVDNKKLVVPVRFAGNAKDGDPVVVTRRGWEARVHAVLDQKDLAALDRLEIAARRGISPVFPAAVLREAEQLSPGFCCSRRLDLRDRHVITVDDPNTLDLDDALSVSKLANGNWEVGIHVADVAHYVAPGSAVDREAYARGQSVYLVDRELPMLPARLAHDLCALVPDRDRPALSCLAEITPAGEVVRYQFAETVIRSRSRIDYDRAATLIERPIGEEGAILAMASRVAAALAGVAQKRGVVKIDLPSPRFVLDQSGVPVAVFMEQNCRARALVEELMLLANHLAVEFLDQQGYLWLARVNPDFDTSQLNTLNAFLARWGYCLPASVGPRDLQQLLAEVAGQPQELPVARQLARYLGKSRYSAVPGRHFTLALDRYTHFTAPIRRYADLFTHRQIKRALAGEKGVKHSDLYQVAEHCCYRERVVQDVENECTELKKLQYLEKITTPSPAVVVEITRAGPLVQHRETAAEGLVVTGDCRQWQPGEVVAVAVHKLDFKAKQVYFAAPRVDRDAKGE